VRGRPSAGGSGGRGVSADDPSPRELHRRARTILARLEHFEGGARFGLVPRTPDVEEVATAVATAGADRRRSAGPPGAGPGERRTYGAGTIRM
jgi:hypothetical protein